MSRQYHLDERYEWVGEFWIEEDPEVKFPGNLSYDPILGVRLATLQQGMTSAEVGNKTIKILGCIREVGLITLLQCTRRGNETHLSTSLGWITDGFFFVTAAVLEKHIAKDEYIAGSTFSFTHIDEFFRPKIQAMTQTHTSIPLLEYDTGLKKWGVYRNTIGYGISNNSISDLLALDENNVEFCNELNTEFTRLLEKHKIKHVVRKSEVYHYVKASDEKLDVSKSFAMIYSVLNLFCMLTLKSCSLEYLTFSFKNNENRQYNTLLTRWASEARLNSAKTESYYHLMPVNYNSLRDSLSHVTNEWEEFSQDELNLVYPVMVEHIWGGYNTMAHCALLISALEQWFSRYSSASQKEKKQRRNKYQWPIDTYCTQEMKDYLDTLLPKKEGKDLGYRMARARAAVLHPKSEEKIKSSDLDNISEMVFIMLLVGLYKKLKIPEESIIKLQEKYPRGMREHYLVE